MPNWCSNELMVTGRPSDVAGFINASMGKDGKFSIQKIFPTPQSLLDVSAGGDEIFHDIKYGDWENVYSRPYVVKACTDKQAIIETREDLINVFEKKEDEFHQIADKYQSNVENFGFKTWYGWRLKNWGTKWDVDGHIEYQDNDDRAVIRFESPWSPPIAALQEISRRFPLLFRCSYFEEGCDFIGVATIKDGNVDDDCTSISGGNLSRFDFKPDPEIIGEMYE